MSPNWEQFKSHYCHIATLGFGLDYSRVKLTPSYLSDKESSAQAAFAEMVKLEAGDIANADEKRMVGHYWLRDASRAPSAELTNIITETLSTIEQFASDVHKGVLKNASGQSFKHLLVVGIGGSALGPQFVSQALRSPKDPMDLYFFDNTDPDGINRVLASIPALAQTLVVVISKSGGTKETRNGQLIAEAAFKKAGLSVTNHFVAVTGDGSELDKIAVAQKWLKRFPMWDWVGGRTSEFSAVGLLPAALQGFPIREMLRGAKEMDEVTRNPKTNENP